MTFSIDRARPEDLDAVSRLAAALMQLHHRLDPARFMVGAGVEDGYRRFLGGLLQDAATVVLVAHVDQQVAGYVYARLEPRDWNLYLEACGHVHDLFVAAEYRRQGIARALLKRALDELYGKGAPRVVLSTAFHNEEAQRLFASLGFRSTMLEMARERD